MESVVLRLVAFVSLGAGLGFSYLAALGFNVHLYLESRAAWIALIAHAMRVLAIAVAFAFFAHRGSLALISSVAGFHAVQTLTINRLTLTPTREL
jgi:hypothetical protein